MDHIQKLFTLKKTNPDDVLNSHVIVSIKVDGTAFQYANEKGLKPAFCKRSSAPNKRGKKLEKFDLTFNDVYFNAIAYLRDFKDTMQPYRFVNFEVFDDNTYHTINYKLKPKHNIVLLSAFDENNKPIDEDELGELADALDVSRVPILFEGVLNENVQDFIKKNYETKEKLFDYLKREFNIVDDEQIEGIVLNFTEAGNKGQGKIYKVNNPWFMEQLYQKLDDESNLGEDNREDMYNLFIDAINSMDISDYDDEEDYFTKLIKVFEELYNENPDVIDKVYEMTYDNVKSFFKEDTFNYPMVENIVSDEFLNKLKKSRKLRFVLRTYLAAFRKTKKRPTDVSQTYLDNVLNPFIEELKYGYDDEEEI